MSTREKEGINIFCGNGDFLNKSESLRSSKDFHEIASSEQITTDLEAESELKPSIETDMNIQESQQIVVPISQEELLQGSTKPQTKVNSTCELVRLVIWVLFSILLFIMSILTGSLITLAFLVLISPITLIQILKSIISYIHSRSTIQTPVTAHHQSSRFHIDTSSEFTSSQRENIMQRFRNYRQTLAIDEFQLELNNQNRNNILPNINSPISMQAMGMIINHSQILQHNAESLEELAENEVMIGYSDCQIHYQIGGSHKFSELKILLSLFQDEHPQQTLPKGEENDTCVVCLDQIQDDELVRILQCLHFSHQTCLDDWLRKKKECPVCRQCPLQAFDEVDLDQQYQETN